VSIYKPDFIREWGDIRRKGGYKLLVREKGWTVVLAFFIFYLIRDSILYLIIPYLMMKDIISC
jgi:hypothetical protein